MKQPNKKITRHIDSQQVLPTHIAVIMDGNGRWAKQRGLPRIAGHKKGVAIARELIIACGKKGIKNLTLFAFSSENWRRPQREVNLLMDLFVNAIDEEVNQLHEKNIRFKVIGDIDRFNKKLKARIKKAKELTQNNTALTLNIAANYGGRWDIASACKELIEEIMSERLTVADINAESLSTKLSLAGIPDPDLFIRTGGEHRISNFLLWQLAYTELYFTPVLWPDFDLNELETALSSFSNRQRRFGQTAEQVESVGHA